jgi:hypothetical protein
MIFIEENFPKNKARWRGVKILYCKQSHASKISQRNKKVPNLDIN